MHQGTFQHQRVGQDLDGPLYISVMTTEDISANSPVLFFLTEMILLSNKAMEEFSPLEDDM
eukprot:15342746-Ditylum_brightwellii.AAC.1